MSIPFRAIADACAPHLEALLRELFPEGKRQGNEWVTGDINGNKGRSLSINLRTGVGQDFATGMKFADIIDAWAEKRCGGDKVEAAKALAARYGIPVNGHALNGRVHTGAPAPLPAAPEYRSEKPPADAPPAPIPKGVTAHVYRDEAGDLLFYVLRREATPTARKTFRGLSWGRLGNDAPAWIWKHPNTPRPLYGLDRLAARRDVPVILVEGEKATDAAEAKFPGHVCMTWPGGSRAVKDCDFSPLANRMVMIWPDNDEVGHKAAREIQRILPRAVILDVTDLPESADAADIEPPIDPDGWIEARMPGPDAHEPPPDLPRDEPEDEESAAALPERVLPLGYDHGRFFYYATGTRQVTMLTAPEHTRAHLTSVASETYWYRNFRQRCGENGSLSWGGVASDLMASCRAVGIYDPARVRGRGVWLDATQIVVHLGDRLIVDGREEPVTRPGSRYVYEVGLPLVAADGWPAPLSAQEAVWLERVSRSLRWEKPSAGRLMAGWIALAAICAALDWRPSIWLTGPAGAGKSWIASHIVRKILGKFSLFVELNTTEPGLRRLLQADALPVIFDEAEQDGGAAAERMKSLMGLVRQASTNSEAVVAKADGRGGVDIFRVRSMFCWQSINTAMASQADISRTEVLELREHSRPDDVPFADIKTIIREHIGDDFGPRLIARSVSLIPQIRANAELFSDAISAMPGQTRRRADQVGILLAGAYSLHSSRVLTPEQAAKFAAEDEWVAETVPAVESRDEMQLIGTIMAHSVRVAPNDYTVSRLVQCALGAEPESVVSKSAAREALLAIGLKFVEHEGRWGLAVSNSHPRLRSILARTPWSASWARALARIPGTVALGPQRFGTMLVARAVWLPPSLLEGGD